MSDPVRLQMIRNRRGFKLQRLSRQTNGLPAMLVTRGHGPWGNPFKVGVAGTQAECVNLFRRMLDGYYTPGRGPSVEMQIDYRKRAIRDMDVLRGRNLACMCPHGTPCHADVLLDIANKPRPWQRATEAAE